MNSANGGKPRALIAEDDDIDRMLLAEATEVAGFEVVAVANGAEALCAALAESFDMALFDVEMPGLDGYELCRRVRRSPHLIHMPIVMITGRDDAASIEIAYQAGATDFASKPLNWTLIPHRLRYILRNADAERRIRELAYIDAVTGLPNRSLFMERLKAALAALAASDERASGQSVAVLCLEVDGFTRINETFGLAVAEEATQAVAQRLLACLSAYRSESAAAIEPWGSPAFELARFERGHFAIFVSGPRSQEVASTLAARIGAAFGELVHCADHDLFLQPVMGIALAPQHGHAAGELVMHADSAKHRARLRGSAAAVVYVEEIGATARARLTLDGDLRRAVRDQQLILYFQPKIRISDGALVGVEALLRWFHPQLGEISPGRFIPLAEESGLILELGDWVIRAACRQLRNWVSEGFSTSIAVNVASTQFVHGTPARTLRDAAAECGVDPGRILVEITESVLVRDLAGVQSGLEAVRALGCRVAVDDFGTGYSSLAYLKELPIDELKIDQSFLRHIETEPLNASIYAAILSLARQLQLSVTAEGVETTGQLEWLRSHGCDEAQGYLIARPMPQWEILRRYGVAGAGAAAAMGTLDEPDAIAS